MILIKEKDAKPKLGSVTLRICIECKDYFHAEENFGNFCDCCDDYKSPSVQLLRKNKQLPKAEICQLCKNVFWKDSRGWRSGDSLSTCEDCKESLRDHMGFD